MSTPAQKLIDKLLSKQQQKLSSTRETSSSSPLILFQYSSRVGLREAAATRSSKTATSSRSRVQQQQELQNAKVQAEADLYRRAQLRTPPENARRSTWGGPLWVQYLSQELMKQSQHGFLWVSTTTRPTPKWIQESSRVSIVTATDLYQAMLRVDNTTTTEQTHPLQTLLDRIQGHITKDSAGCTPIVLESLIPLIRLFGFAPVYHWIQQLLSTPHTILLLPVLTETLEPRQHQQLEDLAHTALWLSNHTGQVDLHVLRRGIREQDSTVREIWDFSIQPTAEPSSFLLVVGKDTTETEEQDRQDAPDQINLLQAMNPALNPEAKPPVDPVATVTQPTKKITLKLEDDNAPPAKSNPVNKNAPRIFLQDDDPEFEDYDEEDPDDDLDI